MPAQEICHPPRTHKSVPSQFELAEYRALVERLAETDSTEIFSNGDSAHAAIIFEFFFRKAKNNVRIVCRNLAEGVFGKETVISAMKDALARSVLVQIVVQETPVSDKFLNLAKQWKEAAFPIQVMGVAGWPFTGDQNFAVMDRKAFRYEPDRDEQIGFASMNCPRNATTLDDLFVSSSPDASVVQSLI